MTPDDTATIPALGPEQERLAALRALGILDTPPEERFDRLTRLATELFDVPIAYVSFVDENREWLKSCCGWDVCETPRAEALCDEVLDREGLLVIEDALADEDFRRHPMVVGEPDVRFYAGRPLHCVDGTAVGTFCIADRRPRRFGPRERRLFEALAEMAERELRLVDMIELQRDLIAARAEADAANQARAEAMEQLLAQQTLQEEELQRAARYVRSLLPEPLHDGPVETDWIFIPSDELGGDAFGYHWLDDDHFAMYLLDVTGHGIGAALHSVSVLNVLRAQTLPNVDFRAPSQVLAALNGAFPMKAHDNLFFTIWYGVFDRTTRRLTYASGGHLPGLLITPPDAGPGIDELRTPAPLIGGMPGMVFPSASRFVPPGSSLYLFSDGIYEIRQDDGTILSLDWFIRIVSENITAGRYDAPSILQRVYEVEDCRRCMDDVALMRLTFP